MALPRPENDLEKFALSRPLTFTFIFLVVVEILFLSSGYAFAAIVPSAPGYMVTLGSEALMLVFASIVILKLGWAGKIGFNPPREWRDLRVLWLPALIITGISVIAFLQPGHPFAFQYIVVAFLATILTGISEETIFRGITLQSLLPKGEMTAVMVSAAVFSILHFNNLIQAKTSATFEGVLATVLYAFLLGIGLGAYRIRTRTIWPDVAFHAIADFPAFLALALGTATINTANPTIAGILVVGGIGSVLACYGLFLIRRDPGVKN